MSPGVNKEAKTIRLVFELARADHPRLYDDLIQFHKGVKRVNRLRVLAHDGLLLQSGLLIGASREPFSQYATSDAQEGSGEITNELFAPAFKG